MINTFQGPKTPAEALSLFKKAKLPKGDLLGIFNQLEGYPEGKEAREHVLANPSSYSDKLKRLAIEKSTGRPIGAKVINNKIDLRQVLDACGLRAQVSITIKKEQARRLRMLLSLKNLEIDDCNKIGLMAVAMSGEWGFVSRTFTATLSLTSDDIFLNTERALFGTVEKIEIMSVLNEHIKEYHAPSPLSDKIKATLAANPSLFYDSSLFLEIYEWYFSDYQEQIGEFAKDTTMEDALMMFRTNDSREEFLEYYLARFMELLVEN